MLARGCDRTQCDALILMKRIQSVVDVIAKKSVDPSACLVLGPSGGFYMHFNQVYES